MSGDTSVVFSAFSAISGVMVQRGVNHVSNSFYAHKRGGVLEVANEKFLLHATPKQRTVCELNTKNLSQPIFEDLQTAYPCSFLL